VKLFFFPVKKSKKKQMASLSEAFNRIMPRYQFHRNQGVIMVEELEHPARTVIPVQQQKRLCECGYCYQMDDCQKLLLSDQ
jgi:hypothetical protein